MTDARTELGEQGWRFFSGLHRVLLRVAGRAPDDWLWLMRRKLGEGALFELPDEIAGGLGDLELAVPVGDVALLREMTRVLHGRDPLWLTDGGELPVEAEVPETDHLFFPVPGEVLASDGTRIPAHLDLTGHGQDLWDLPPALESLADLALRMTDGPDHDVLTLPRDHDGVRSISRAWRFPPGAKPTDGVRVVLVELAEFTPAWEVTAETQADLAQYGELTPQVEVYWTGTEPTPYHRAALAGGALLWTAEQDGA